MSKHRKNLGKALAKAVERSKIYVKGGADLLSDIFLKKKADEGNNLSQ